MLVKKYNTYVSKNINIMRLIQKFDKVKNRVLDSDEVHGLLSVMVE